MTIHHLVIGAGEVGTALADILNADLRDLNPSDQLAPTYEVVHIAFPWNAATFVDDVHNYADEYAASHIVIHSTVPVGTCDRWGWNFSPITGQHPNLADAIRIFVKPIGGPDARTLAAELHTHGIPATHEPRARDLEASKLLDLALYATQIVAEKAAWNWCQTHHVDYDIAYTDAGHRYNGGYRILGLHQYVRPILRHMPGPIGGHCVTQNVPLMDNPFFNHILRTAEAFANLDKPDHATPTDGDTVA